MAEKDKNSPNLQSRPTQSSAPNLSTAGRPVPPQTPSGTISARQTPIVPKSTLSETQAQKPVDKKKQKTKDHLKSSNISIDDLETINENNLKQYRSRVTRNRFVIITLIILLVAAITTIAVIVGIQRMVNNCEIKVHGNVSADCYVDGQQLNKFRTPIGVQGNRVYLIDTDIDIHSSGNYNVYFTIEVFQAGVKLNNTFAYEYNHDLFHATEDGKYVSNSAIAGGRRIDLFNGVVLDNAYEETLTTDNFTMEINVYFERA